MSQLRRRLDINLKRSIEAKLAVYDHSPGSIYGTHWMI